MFNRELLLFLFLGLVSAACQSENPNGSSAAQAAPAVRESTSRSEAPAQKWVGHGIKSNEEGKILISQGAKDLIYERRAQEIHQAIWCSYRMTLSNLSAAEINSAIGNDERAVSGVVQKVEYLEDSRNVSLQTCRAVVKKLAADSAGKPLVITYQMNDRGELEHDGLAYVHKKIKH